MKKYLFSIFIIFLFFGCIKKTEKNEIILDNISENIVIYENQINDNTINDQYINIQKIMYVISKTGLIQRSEPSVNSERIGTLLFGHRIVVNQRGLEATIDGITDYWYGVLIQPSRRGEERYWWVFGGYLSENFPEDAPVILGLWDDLNNKDVSYHFYPNGDYFYNIKELGHGTYGNWNLDGNIITIKLLDSTVGVPFGEPYIIDETITATLNEIDKNNIILNFTNGEILNLIRLNEPW